MEYGDMNQKSKKPNLSYIPKIFLIFVKYYQKVVILTNQPFERFEFVE